MWLYNNEKFDKDITNYAGFVYSITNLLSGRRYIGKKFFWSIKRKQVKKIRKRIKVESDWKEYWSSSDELKADIELLGKDNFKREIIYLCINKGTVNYLEAKEQFKHAVLENSDEWYNSWISVKTHKSHLKICR